VLNMISHSFAALTREISCSTLEINLVFPRTHVLFSIYFGCISLNIACKFKCYVSKYKLVLAECDDFYFIDIAIAFIAFTLHEIFGTLGMLM
jgi:hypothetical protein